MLPAEFLVRFNEQAFAEPPSEPQYEIGIRQNDIRVAALRCKQGTAEAAQQREEASLKKESVTD